MLSAEKTDRSARAEKAQKTDEGDIRAYRKKQSDFHAPMPLMTLSGVCAAVNDEAPPMRNDCVE